MRQTATVSVAQGLVSVFSSASPNNNSINEDSAAVLPVSETSAVLVVADGTGGSRAGDQASRVAVRALAQAVARAKEIGGELRNAILDGFELANRRVRELGLGAATTLSVLEVSDGIVRPYHVGDSLILAFGQRGKIKLQTVSHSPVGYAIEAGLLDSEDALQHRERHIVSNLVGSVEMRIEIGPQIELLPYDTVILASDGLSDNLRISEIIDSARVGSLSDAVHALAGSSVLRMVEPEHGEPSKPDDLTIVAFRACNPANAI